MSEPLTRYALSVKHWPAVGDHAYYPHAEPDVKGNWVKWSEVDARLTAQAQQIHNAQHSLESERGISAGLAKNAADLRAHRDALQARVTALEAASEMSQAFVDAVCNVAYAKDPEQHWRDRYRGIEGQNGVGCQACRVEAQRIWDDYRRILGRLGTL